MKTNIILIDYENVQPKDLAGLRGSSFQIRVFCGGHQSKVPVHLAKDLQPFGENADYIQIQGTGKNALDFHIAYYIGRMSSEFPDATFYIISKDRGFEPLIKHLKSQNTTCYLRASIAGLLTSPAPKTRPTTEARTTTSATADRIQKISEGLLMRKENKPRTLKRLTAFIKAQLGNEATETAVGEVITILKRDGVSIGADGKLAWP